MEQFAFCIGVLAVGALGLSAGSLLAEAGVLVPFWKSLPAANFLSWYREHAQLLLRFFGPLEVASAVLVVAATALSWLDLLGGQALFTAATGLTILVLLSFPLYFQKANASFATGAIPEADVRAELARWAAWHWARTVLAVLSFGVAVVALAGR